MYTKNQFFSDFIRAYGYLGPANFRFGQLADSAARYIDMCFQVYNNAATNPLGALVVGRIVKKNGTGDRINLKDIGYGLDDVERQNFGRTDVESGGAVLDTASWTVAMNDSWLMGGVHAQLDFYLASPRTVANIVDAQFGATVTGRELLGLTTFGYTLHPETRLGEVFVCTDRARARSASFVAYEEAFSAAKERGGFAALVNANA